jgi:hypothetical protein
MIQGGAATPPYQRQENIKAAPVIRGGFFIYAGFLWLWDKNGNSIQR